MPRASAAARRRARDDLLDDHRAAAPAAEAAIEHTTRVARALVKDIQYRLDVNTLHRDQGAGPQRDRPGLAAHHGPAAVRPLLQEPHHRVLYPHRRGHRRHRRCGHDQQPELRPTAGTGGSSTITWPPPPRDREFLFVVGAAKAGTTSLHAYLDAHAGVHMSDPKEPHFFARAINPSVRTKSWDTYAEAFRGATENAILGDASTSYLWDPAGADLIHEALPDSRIVVLLRDPVARAISHYTMDVGNGRQRRSFDDALRADAAIRERIWGVKSHLYIDLGMYASQVRRYLDTFGRDRVLILESATLRKSRSAALTQIARFLGIDPSGFDEARLDDEHNLMAMPRSIQLHYVATRPPLRRVSKILPAGVRSAIRRGLSSTEPRIRLETRRRLQDHFAPDVNALRDVTGLPLRSLTSNWR